MRLSLGKLPLPQGDDGSSQGALKWKEGVARAAKEGVWLTVEGLSVLAIEEGWTRFSNKREQIPEMNSGATCMRYR